MKKLICLLALLLTVEAGATELQCRAVNYDTVNGEGLPNEGSRGDWNFGIEIDNDGVCVLYRGSAMGPEQTS